MKKIAIITDSSCDLPEDLIRRYHIYILPLRIIYSDREYEDGVDISAEDVYRRFDEEVPSTSLPAPHLVNTYIEEMLDRGIQDVIGIFISSGLSGTYNMVKQMLADEKRLNYRLYDSKSLSLGLGFIVLKVATYIEQGFDINDIDSLVHNEVAKTKTYYVIKTLEYLKKGGRIGMVEGTIGDLLNIKPIISINDKGVYYTYKKVRGRKRSIMALIDIVKSSATQPLRVGILHGDAIEEAKYIKREVELIEGVADIYLEQLSPVLTVHTGPGLLGVVCQHI